MTLKPGTFPVQTRLPFPQAPGAAPQAVVLRAYEVYCKLYGPQPAMVTGGCRGGFSAGELIAFLYARTFPPEEWRAREQEAFKDLNV